MAALVIHCFQLIISKLHMFVNHFINYCLLNVDLRINRDDMHMNRQKAGRFAKYFTMLFLSLLFVILIVIVALGLNIIISTAMMIAVAVVSSIIAGRDAGYFDLF